MTDLKEGATIEMTTVDFRVSMNVTDYLFDSQELQITEQSLTSEQWVNVLRKLITQCKPYLRYFDGFQEIGYLIDHQWWNKVNLFDNPSFQTKIEYSKGVNEKTRVISITKSGVGLGFDKGPKLEYSWTGSKMSPIDRYYVNEEIFLTSQGKIILISSEYDRGLSTDKASKLYFQELDDIVLSNFVQKSFDRIIDPICCLGEILDAGIKRRQEQLSKIEGINALIYRVASLIE